MNKEIKKVLEVLFNLKDDEFYFNSYGMELIQGLINSQWISVEKKLPKDTKDVIIFHGAGFVAVGSCWERYDYWLVGNNHYYDVTHWQPLPKPPKQVK